MPSFRYCLAANIEDCWVAMSAHVTKH
jgi:hypothetical protein